MTTRAPPLTRQRFSSRSFCWPTAVASPAAGADAPAAGDATAVGQQNDLEENRWRVSGGALVVIAVTSFACGQIAFVVDQIGSCVFEGAGEKLSIKINRQQFQSRVNRLEARHGILLVRYFATGSIMPALPSAPEVFLHPCLL